MERFKTAQDAFETLYARIERDGMLRNGTKALFNVGFYIDRPKANAIETPWRKWSEAYARREWQWYLSGDPSVIELVRYAPIWNSMHGGDFIVNSNYGHAWMETNQLLKTQAQLIKNPNTRQAYISIFDGKRKDQYAYDTPCTLAIGFRVIDKHLCMDVLMRSNDLWYGFCNDQYCFSRLQIEMAEYLGLSVGWYYHHAADMHLYIDKLGKSEQSQTTINF
jgi:thymidylate synthase